MTSLATGVGDVQISIELDRGTPADEAIARFERVGPRIHFVVRNSRFAALSSNEHLAHSVEESFVTSTLASLDVVVEDGGRVLADARRSS